MDRHAPWSSIVTSPNNAPLRGGGLRPTSHVFRAALQAQVDFSTRVFLHVRKLVTAPQKHSERAAQRLKAPVWGEGSVCSLSPHVFEEVGSCGVHGLGKCSIV